MEGYAASSRSIPCLRRTPASLPWEIPPRISGVTSMTNVTPRYATCRVLSPARVPRLLLRDDGATTAAGGRGLDCGADQPHTRRRRRLLTRAPTGSFAGRRAGSRWATTASLQDETRFLPARAGRRLRTRPDRRAGRPLGMPTTTSDAAASGSRPCTGLRERPGCPPSRRTRWRSRQAAAARAKRRTSPSSSPASVLTPLAGRSRREIVRSRAYGRCAALPRSAAKPSR